MKLNLKRIPDRLIMIGNPPVAIEKRAGRVLGVAISELAALRIELIQLNILRRPAIKNNRSSPAVHNPFLRARIIGGDRIGAQVVKVERRPASCPPQGHVEASRILRRSWRSRRGD